MTKIRLHKYSEQGIGNGYNLGFTIFSSWGDGQIFTYDFSSSEIVLNQNKQFEEVQVTGPIVGMRVASLHVVDSIKIWSCSEPGPETVDQYITELRSQLSS